MRHYEVADGVSLAKAETSEAALYTSREGGIICLEADVHLFGPSALTAP